VPACIVARAVPLAALTTPAAVEWTGGAGAAGTLDPVVAAAAAVDPEPPCEEPPHPARAGRASSDAAAAHVRADDFTRTP